MLTLNRIRLTHFKNYLQTEFKFEQNVVAIAGLNGKGKTNLLDAIHYLCLAKSYFSATDQMVSHFGKEGFRLEGYFEESNRKMDVVCINRGTKKELLLNGLVYDKFSQHIGLLPLVMIAPDDVELITGASAERRRFLDMLLSQLDSNYLLDLIRYNKILQQRNAQLKLMAAQPEISSELLDVLDQQLIPLGTSIYNKRSELCTQMVPNVEKFYQRISGNREAVYTSYQSQLETESFEDLLKASRSRDIFSQRSNAGIHKDELSFTLEGKLFRYVASQGQRKSLLFALKLAEFELLKETKGFAPILLLDDVFEKLDGLRMNHLLEWVCAENQGQVFITDTHKQRLEEAFDSVDVNFQLIELE